MTRTRQILGAGAATAAALGVLMGGVGAAQAATPGSDSSPRTVSTAVRDDVPGSYALHSSNYEVSWEFKDTVVQAACGDGFHIDATWKLLDTPDTEYEWTTTVKAYGDDIYLDEVTPLGGSLVTSTPGATYQAMEVHLGNSGWANHSGSFSWTCDPD